MNIFLSYNWLKEFVGTKKKPAELAQLLSLHSMSVERVIPEVELLTDKIVLGEIISVKPHPNADRLKLATVSTGDEKHNVVCGAPNIEKGMKVAFAKLGAMVRWHGEGDPVELVPAKIRGEESFGMICDDVEVGLADKPNPDGVTDYSGLKAKPGTAMAKALGLDDTIFDIEITTNRIDAASVLGMARETAAITGERLKGMNLKPIKAARKKPLKITIQDKNKCLGFRGIVLDVKVGPSPEWLQRRLRAAGHTPINNVVDVTNYVMREVGHPLHAFDYDKVAGGALVIRAAKKGEKLKTLDGKEETLEVFMPVVADKKRGLAIGGVMGGEESAISEQTTTVLLEVADWDSSTVRKTSMALDKFSDASAYFTRKVSPQLSADAILRAIQLLQEVAKAKIMSPLVETGYGKYKPAKVKMSLERAEQLIGAQLNKKTVMGQLKALGFEVKESKGQLECLVPHWRQFDVSIEEDLVEETARLYGYHNITNALPSGEIPRPIFDAQLEYEDRLKTLMKGAGYTELYTYSTVSERLLELSEREVKSALRLLNPLDDEHVALRTRLLPSLLEVAAQNQGQGSQQHVFEIAHTYLPRKKGELPDERSEMAGLVVTNDLESSMRQVKGIVLRILKELGLEHSVDFQPSGNGFSYAIDKKKYVEVGVVPNRAARAVGLKRPAVAFEIRLADLVRLARHQVTYRPVPRFPSVDLDLSVTVSEETPWGMVEQTVYQAGLPLLKSIELFDIYHHGDGKKSFGFHLSYRDDERTLEMNNVEPVQKKVVKALESTLGAKLRA